MAVSRYYWQYHTKHSIKDLTLLREKKWTGIGFLKSNLLHSIRFGTGGMQRHSGSEDQEQEVNFSYYTPATRTLGAWACGTCPPPGFQAVSSAADNPWASSAVLLISTRRCCELWVRLPDQPFFSYLHRWICCGGSASSRKLRFM